MSIKIFIQNSMFWIVSWGDPLKFHSMLGIVGGVSKSRLCMWGPLFSRAPLSSVNESLKFARHITPGLYIIVKWLSLLLLLTFALINLKWFEERDAIWKILFWRKKRKKSVFFFIPFYVFICHLGQVYTLFHLLQRKEIYIKIFNKNWTKAVQVY